eukprot:scpid12222/ scgid24513/ Rho GTPase-activating protein 35; Glucocorticoid receptor DNA-binding factor 1; Rho GAP p190A
MSEEQGPKYLVKCFVSVLGLSGRQGSVGVGKSCLCSRFCQPDADQFDRLGSDHSSVLSSSLFRQPEVNGEHFLFFGRVSMAYPNAETELRVNVVEHTTFIDESSMAPFRNSKHYAQRALMEKIKSPGRVQYHNKSLIGASANQDKQIRFPEDFHKRGLDGYIFVMDPTAQADHRQAQLDLLVECVKKVPKRKPFTVVLSKCDALPQAIQERLGEGFSLVRFFSNADSGASKGVKQKYGAAINDIAVFFSSSRFKICIDPAFCYIAHIAQGLGGAPTPPISFRQSYALRMQHTNLLCSTALSLLRQKDVVAPSDTWSVKQPQLMMRSAFKTLLFECGMADCTEVFQMRVAELRLQQNAVQYGTLARQSTAPPGAEVITDIPEVRRALCEHQDLRIYTHKPDELKVAMKRNGINVARIGDALAGKPRFIRLSPADGQVANGSPGVERPGAASTSSPMTPRPVSPHANPPHLNGLVAAVNDDDDEDPAPPPVPVKCYSGNDALEMPAPAAEKALGTPVIPAARAAANAAAENENAYDCIADICTPSTSVSAATPPPHLNEPESISPYATGNATAMPQITVKLQAASAKSKSEPSAANDVWEAVPIAQLKIARERAPQPPPGDRATSPAKSPQKYRVEQRPAIYEEMPDPGLKSPVKSPVRSPLDPLPTSSRLNEPTNLLRSGSVDSRSSSVASDYDDIVIKKPYLSSQPARAASLDSSSVPSSLSSYSAEPLYDDVAQTEANSAYPPTSAAVVLSPPSSGNDVLYDTVLKENNAVEEPVDPQPDDDLPPPVEDLPPPPPAEELDGDLPPPPPELFDENADDGVDCDPPPPDVAFPPPPNTAPTPPPPSSSYTREGYCEPLEFGVLQSNSTASNAPAPDKAIGTSVLPPEAYEDVSMHSMLALSPSGEHAVVRRPSVLQQNHQNVQSSQSSLPPASGTAAISDDRGRTDSYSDVDSLRPTAMFAARLARESAKDKDRPKPEHGHYDQPLDFPSITQSQPQPTTASELSSSAVSATRPGYEDPVDLSAHFQARRKDSAQRNEDAYEEPVEFQMGTQLPASTTASSGQEQQPPLYSDANAVRPTEIFAMKLAQEAKNSPPVAPLSRTGYEQPLSYGSGETGSDGAAATSFYDGILEDSAGGNQTGRSSIDDDGGNVRNEKMKKNRLDSTSSLSIDVANLEALLENPDLFGALLTKSASVPEQDTPYDSLQLSDPQGPPDERAPIPPPTVSGRQRPFHLMSKSVHTDGARPPTLARTSATLPPGSELSNPDAASGAKSSPSKSGRPATKPRGAKTNTNGKNAPLPVNNAAASNSDAGQSAKKQEVCCDRKQ